MGCASCCRWSGWHRAPGIWKKMKWNIFIPFPEKGNHWPLILLLIVKRSYDSGFFCSPATIKGLCCEWSFLPNVLSYSRAVYAPPPRMCTFCSAAGLSSPGLGFGSVGAYPKEASVVQTTVWSWSMGGRMLHKAWTVLEPVINAQEALPLRGPH